MDTIQAEPRVRQQDRTRPLVPQERGEAKAKASRHPWELGPKETIVQKRRDPETSRVQSSTQTETPSQRQPAQPPRSCQEARPRRRVQVAPRELSAGLRPRDDRLAATASPERNYIGKCCGGDPGSSSTDCSRQDRCAEMDGAVLQSRSACSPLLMLIFRHSLATSVCSSFAVAEGALEGGGNGMAWHGIACRREKRCVPGIWPTPLVDPRPRGCLSPAAFVLSVFVLFLDTNLRPRLVEAGLPAGTEYRGLATTAAKGRISKWDTDIPVESRVGAQCSFVAEDGGAAVCQVAAIIPTEVISHVLATWSSPDDPKIRHVVV
ncbi:hypothetical protein CMUS01_08586 [Colletotrichum musicola]|uniref:Uncharacterized protein n=1 Tax=Colletotrichum musicola TaxID=2175873 RepID=A0A8H6KCK2_9PEZI|nr:hypothetical protein CMUS01_08586 [Colletotrichum musicola]